MTCYFDDLHSKLSSLNAHAPSEADFKTLREIEHQAVFDCTVNAQFPEFPADLRQELHEVILRGGVETQSRILPIELQADFETFEQHVQRIMCLVGDLHTIAHMVARREDCPFGDSPMSGVMSLFSDGEEIRDEMAAAIAGTTVEAYIKELNR